MSTPEHNFVEVFRASSAPQLEVLRIRLEKEGIPVVVEGEVLVGLAAKLPSSWQNSPRIMVDETHEDEAVAIIREILLNKQKESNKASDTCQSCHFPFEENATRCSRCGWSFLQKPVPTKNNTGVQPVSETPSNEVGISAKTRWMFRIGFAVLVAVVGYVGFKIVTDTKEELEAGIVALEKGNFDQSVALLTKVIRWDSKNAEAYHYRSRAYFEKKQYDKALADINEAIRLERNPFDLGFRGLVYIALQNYEASLADFNAVLELQWPDEITLDNRGYCYYMLKQYGQAIEDYQKALKIKPTNYQLRLNLASAFIRLGRWSDAIDEAEKARELTNDNHVVLIFLSLIYSSCSEDKFRNGPLALVYAKEALEDSKNNPGYLDTLAAVYAENGNFDLAVESQQKALADKNFATGDVDQEKAIADAKARLELYRNRKPLRLTPSNWE